MNIKYDFHQSLMGKIDYVLLASLNKKHCIILLAGLSMIPC